MASPKSSPPSKSSASPPPPPTPPLTMTPPQAQHWTGTSLICIVPNSKHSERLPNLLSDFLRFRSLLYFGPD
ncbi:hypothetical protein LOK49_LG08G01706 [Camellia lanceoleosa]|uniref:Uncharacterized protein n=1 Tax=Camellia lanceoleosa TaxID=1840588 RepID=A0ACC0GSC8_9ERIC|nr:hypothetical protein LOK49_LG08G01706 [Camellia lanceoleosa]